MLPLQLNQQNQISPPQPPQVLSSALSMDPSQHLQLQQPQPPGQPLSQPAQPSSKRRKRADGASEDAPPPAEPRRLRRSHEACTRCRSKKIKCDSKHPRCTSCSTAGTECNQEDRHRQTLTPRGYTERLEHQLAQCEALLKRHIPGFTRENLDDFLAREGIEVGLAGPAFPMDPTRPFRPEAASQHPKGYPPIYGPPMMGPYPPPMMPYPPHYQLPMHGPPGAYGLHPPPFPPGVPPYPPGPPPPPVMQPNQPEQSMQPAPPPSPPTIRSAVSSAATKGTDPHGHDMSSAKALARAFGVSDMITATIKLDPVPTEDMPVNPNAKFEVATPRDASHWITVSIRRDQSAGGTTLSLYGPVSKSTQVEAWLPKDRKFAKLIVDVYFSRLNIHRPVYARKDFDKILNDLYEGVTQVYDPGHLCSIFLIFALGTLSELNNRAVTANLDAEKHGLGSSVAKKLMPDWPSHDEFFERALLAKTDLEVSITSLQALILLHWYLYIGRPFRNTWRLVGTLIRLSVELGLHHDPTTQVIPGGNQHLFTEEESQQRIRLWACVTIHDRGTSILLGRPLAISTSDSNTPQPLRSKNAPFAEFSEHFELSQPVADIQADIINSLYAPTRQSPDTIWRNATRIIKRMTEFRRSLPDKYQYYFSGSQDWSMEKRIQLVAGITEDAGLTLLKIGIARILMLRALFSSKELTYAQKHKALVDAIIVSHNVIIVHHQLIRFPDIAFFTSPIPLHLAAMVILYGHISKVECLPHAVALEDIWMALDMLPRFRWRWERKDVQGAHPLIAKLAEHVMGVDLQTVKPSSAYPPVLRDEPDWEEPTSPSLKSQHSTPVLPAAYAPGNSGPVFHHPNGPINRSSSGESTPPDKHLAEVPQGLFYPFYPEATVPVMTVSNHGGATSSTKQQDYKKLMLAAAAVPPDGYVTQAHEVAYISEEKDRGGHSASSSAWIAVNSRPIEYGS